MNHKERKEHLDRNMETHVNLLLAKVLNFAPYLEDLLHTERNGKKAKLPQLLQSAYDQTISQVDHLYKGLEGRIKQLEERSKSSGSTSMAGYDSTMGPEIKRRMDNADAKSADLEFLLNEAHSTIEDLRQQLTKASIKVEKAEETVRQFDRRLEEQENVAILRNVTIADLEEKVNGTINNSYDGILLFKINEVARRRADATSGRHISFYSPPFYTDQHGYKMCARVYLNGDGMGRGSHISLFFVIMRGEYDALLKWPFRQKVMMLLVARCPIGVISWSKRFINC